MFYRLIFAKLDVKQAYFCDGLGKRLVCRHTCACSKHGEFSDFDREDI